MPQLSYSHRYDADRNADQQAQHSDKGRPKKLILALGAFYDPSILKGDRILTVEDDEGELEDVSVQYVAECLEEWATSIQFFDDWEAGFFTVTVSEIQAMPCAALDARRIHRTFLNEQRRAHRK